MTAGGRLAVLSCAVAGCHPTGERATSATFASSSAASKETRDVGRHPLSAADAATSGRAPRTLDASPRVSVVLPALAAGHAEARFEFDTGGDVMSLRPKEAGLAVVVRYHDKEVRQTFASCAEPSRGNALGDIGGDILDLAVCNGFYRLRSEPGAVSVEGERADGVLFTVTRIPLPLPGERATLSGPYGSR